MSHLGTVTKPKRKSLGTIKRNVTKRPVISRLRSKGGFSGILYIQESVIRPTHSILMSKLLISVSILIVLIQVGKACFSSGIGCCGPPPPAPVCSGGCGGGYGCGPYGCARLKARGSKTLKIRNDDDQGETDEVDKSQQTPDEKFMACCLSRRLPDQCLSKCSFSSYNRNALQNMYFRADSCPMQAAADLQFCAAQGRDHRECCARNGVGTTIAGQKCLLFCDQRPGNTTQLDLSYMSCFDKFENMKGCFWHDIVERTKRTQPFRS